MRGKEWNDDTWRVVKHSQFRVRVARLTLSQLSYGGPWRRMTYNIYNITLENNTCNMSAPCRGPGANWGPSDLQSDALPTELSRLMTIDGYPLYIDASTLSSETWQILRRRQPYAKYAPFAETQERTGSSIWRSANWAIAASGSAGVDRRSHRI